MPKRARFSAVLVTLLLLPPLTIEQLLKLSKRNLIADKPCWTKHTSIQCMLTIFTALGSEQRATIIIIFRLFCRFMANEPDDDDDDAGCWRSDYKYVTPECVRRPRAIWFIIIPGECERVCVFVGSQVCWPLCDKMTNKVSARELSIFVHV